MAKCGCIRISVPIYGTMQTAFRYETERNCPNGHDESSHWRRLSDGKDLTHEELKLVEVNLERYREWAEKDFQLLDLKSIRKPVSSEAVFTAEFLDKD